MAWALVKILAYAKPSIKAAGSSNRLFRSCPGEALINTIEFTRNARRIRDTLTRNRTARDHRGPERFLRANAWRVLGISVLLLVPCFWHRRIEASDLASHTYNAWLAQLIARVPAPGLHVVPQATNVLFDTALARLSGLIGLDAAERVVVAACVLTFFWGAFALTGAVTARPPWFFAPALAMVAHGWTFSMGLMSKMCSYARAPIRIPIRGLQRRLQ
jgi:hypothetical protein